MHKEEPLAGAPEWGRAELVRFGIALVHAIIQL